jgi:hypothetical protein
VSHGWFLSVVVEVKEVIEAFPVFSG